MNLVDVHDQAARAGLSDAPDMQHIAKYPHLARRPGGRGDAGAALVLGKVEAAALGLE
jgi:hypothetical protein